MRWLDKDEILLEVGRVTKVFNFKNEIYLLTKEEISFLNLSILFIAINKKPVPFFIEKVSVLRGNLLKIKLSNTKSIEDLSELLGSVVMLRENEIKIKNKVIDKLIKLKGFILKDKNSKFSGIISDYINRPSQPLLVVIGENKDIVYIPFVKPLITKISYKNKCIYCNLPEGLVE